MNECKYRRLEDQTCRLKGGKADPDRCAGCRWKEEENTDVRFVANGCLE